MAKHTDDAGARDAGTLTVDSDESAIRDQGAEPSRDLGDLYGIDEAEIGVTDSAGDEEEEDAEELEGEDAEGDEDLGDEDSTTEDTEDAEEEDEEEDDEDSSDSEEDDEEEEEDSESDSEEASPKLVKEVKKLRKRAQEAEAQRGELTTENQALKDQVAHLQAAKVVPTPTAQDPLADVQDVATLTQVREAHQATLDWIEDNADAIRDLGEGETLEFPFYQQDGKPVGVSKAQIDRIKQTARSELRAVPGREAWLKDRTTYTTALEASFPDLKKAGSQLRKEVDAVFAANPELKRFSRSENIAMAQVIGQGLIQKLGPKAWDYVINLEKPTAKKAAKPKASRVPGVGGQRPTAGAKTKRQRDRMRQRRTDTKQISKRTAADSYGVSDDELR